MRHNNIELNIEGDVELNVEFSAAVAPDTGPTVLVIETAAAEDGKNGTASKGAGPQTKSWTHRAAAIFDEVEREQCRSERLDYQPFNWQVCGDESFRQLKNLKEKGIEPDYKAKHGQLPDDQKLEDCFRIIFTLAWHYFRKIQKDTSGAFHYTPTSVYTSYNRIKKFKINGSNIITSNGSEASAGIKFGSGIDHFGTFDPKRGY